MQRQLRIFAIVLSIATTAVVASASSQYEETIKPLLVAKCAACHGSLKQEAGLRLDAAQFIRAGGDSGPILAEGDAAASQLFERVSTSDISYRMPPDGEGEALDKGQLAELSKWIYKGATLPERESVPSKPEDHWAYQSPRRSDVPNLNDESNPVDAFISDSQREAGVVPVIRADKATLLRRVYLDLTGLPPSRSELHKFINNDSADAYGNLVDRLLSSPQHGERWARHWMDVWRYSDWDGYKQQLRGSQRHIWRWREWIIESLNSDKGYDQMVREMLAGDEIAPTDNDVLRATGFLARNYHKSNRNIWLDATVEHTAKAFLGLTIDCARCHDHKFDPIAQLDYYRMRAIFEPHKVRIDRLPGNADLTEQGLVRAFDSGEAVDTYLYIAGNEKQPDKENPLTPGIPKLFGDLPASNPLSLPAEAWVPARHPFIKQEELVDKRKAVEKARTALDKLLDSTSEEKSSDAASMANLALPLAHAKFVAAKASLASFEARWAADEAKFVTKTDDTKPLASKAARLERVANLRAAEVALLIKQAAILSAPEQQDKAKRETASKKATKERAEAESKLVKAHKAAQATDAEYTAVGRQYPKTSTGRRLALADWIASGDNPLTARVAVNHIWLRHFGQPLVANVFDFGLRSDKPKHAELLDWLAVELVEHDWSMKHLHRLIVTSQTYQRASTALGNRYMVSRELDADNLLFWHANVQRLEAEAVRDAVLAVSGSLDLSAGGPDIAHAKGETIPRRSLYFQHAYEKQMRMLVLFDAANPTDCYRRVESIVPQQALALANSTLALEESRKLARQLSEQAASESEFVSVAFEQILTRSATNEELASCRRFLSSQASLLQDTSKLSAFVSSTKTKTPPSSDPALRAREGLVHVLLNHNDFVTVR